MHPFCVCACVVVLSISVATPFVLLWKENVDCIHVYNKSVVLTYNISSSFIAEALKTLLCVNTGIEILDMVRKSVGTRQGE